MARYDHMRSVARISTQRLLIQRGPSRKQCVLNRRCMKALSAHNRLHSGLTSATTASVIMTDANEMIFSHSAISLSCHSVHSLLLQALTSAS